MTEEVKKQRERRMAIIAEFMLMDDVFMSDVPDGQNEIVELILRIILERDDLRVTSVETQRELQKPHDALDKARREGCRRGGGYVF